LGTDPSFPSDRYEPNGPPVMVVTVAAVVTVTVREKYEYAM